MEVAIVGGHGKVARHLTRLLAGRGDRVRGIIRRQEQADDLRHDGAQPVVLDMEEAAVGAVAEAVRGGDAVVFAAGAGPGSGAARKETVDYGAAVKLLEAARQAGVRRYLMVSSIGAGHPPDGDDVFNVYLRAKARADAALMASDLAWTVVRPGGLTDDPGTGRVRIAPSVGSGRIPREDVAGVLAACLDDDRAVGAVFEVVGGDTPILNAIAALAG